jgi:hypothetical protein
MERKCKSCEFWRKFGQTEDAECHRNAPPPSIKSEKTAKKGNMWPSTVWPMTHFDQWCGEFQPKQDN